MEWAWSEAGEESSGPGAGWGSAREVRLGERTRGQVVQGEEDKE